MKKKLAAGLVTLLSVATLAACTNTTSSEDKLVTMKGDYITVSDFYDQVKSTTAAQQAMLTLVLERVMEEQYGDKVTDKEVTEAYNKTVESYGDSFSAALSQAGMTTDTYRQQIRVQMLLDYAVEQAAQKELTEDNLKKAYESYQPDTKIQVIEAASEEDAKSVREEATKDGADFAKVAKEKTTAADSKYEYTISSSSSDLPTEVMDQAFKQEKDKVSEVITVLDPTTYAYKYYVVKTVEKTEKNEDWKTYEKELKELVLKQKKADTDFQNSIVAAALEKANVRIKDQSFSSILSQYSSTLNGSDSSTTASETTTTETTTKAE